MGSSGPGLTRRAFAGLMAGTAAAVLAGPSRAQTDAGEPSGPRLVATRNADIPAGSPVAVEMREDSEINVRLREEILQRLAEAGYETDSAGPLVLYFSTQAYGRNETPGRPSLGEFRADAEGNRSFRLNLFSTREDSVLTGRRETGTPPPSYRLSFQLRAGAEILWHGYAEHQRDFGDAYRSLLPLVRAVVDRFGADGAHPISLN